ncbi:hypothetical protein EXU34_19070 [Alteromonas sp. ZYF713]|nr:hypothetical protein [Alteromonas sp. ZYF713]
MTKLTIGIFALVLTVLGGCASQPAYRAAESGGYGYNETKLTDTQYRVYFKGRGSDKTKAMDYAMLRAAEVTIEQGYDWFVVANRETLIDREKVTTEPQVGFSQRYTQVTNCGVLTCRTERHPRSTLSAGVFVGGKQSSTIESVLDVQLGRGVRPDDAQSYDARQVAENLAPE